MRIRLDAARPYQDSLRWELSRNYFGSQGTEVFVSGEVPCAMTSNQCFAAQKAGVVLAGLQASEPAAGEPIRVLELAGGMGGFALHFISAFEELCASAGLDFAARLEYWLSDYSPTTLRALASHPVFAERIAQGRLRLCSLDVSRPQQAYGLDGEAIPLDRRLFTAIVANYLFCALPTAMLLYSEVLPAEGNPPPVAGLSGQFWQLESEIFAWLTGSPGKQAPLDPQAASAALETLAAAIERTQPASLISGSASEPDAGLRPDQLPLLAAVLPQVAARLRRASAEPGWPDRADLRQSLLDWLLEAWLAETAGPHAPVQDSFAAWLDTSVLAPLLRAQPWSQTQLEESLNYAPIKEPQPFDPEQQALLAELLADIPEASFTYPQTCLQALEALGPSLLPAGMFLISDKGVYGREMLHGRRFLPASMHGNSVAQDLNFPLLAIWFARQGYGCRWTGDESAALQTLLATPKLTPALEQGFSASFLERNLNIDYQYLFEAGSALMGQNRAPEAVLFWLRALRARPADAMLLYRLSLAYLSLGHPDKALACLERPHDGYFLGADFNWLRAEALRMRLDFPQAIAIYRQLLEASEKPRQQARLYYHLGLCERELGQQAEARLHFGHALRLAPDDAKLAQAINEMM